jgi:hypothetical protein
LAASVSLAVKGRANGYFDSKKALWKSIPNGILAELPRSSIIIIAGKKYISNY